MQRGCHRGAYFFARRVPDRFLHEGVGFCLLVSLLVAPLLTLCNLCALCDSVVKVSLVTLVHHRGTERTKVAQRVHPL